MWHALDLLLVLQSLLECVGSKMDSAKLPIVPTVCGACMAPYDPPGPLPHVAISRVAVVPMATAGCFACCGFVRELVRELVILLN